MSLAHMLKTAAMRILDLALAPLVLLTAPFLWAVRRIGLHRLTLCRRCLLWIGVLPIRKHYYEPLADAGDFHLPLEQERPLPGIDWNADGQLEFLRSLRYERELDDLLAPRTSPLQFRLANGSFESGDAEFLYQLIRAKQPRRFFEIGSGQSTLIARRAILKNAEESPAYSCKHVCIEPFEAPWLEQTGAVTIRSRVEDVDRRLFAELAENDVLFIDSSHVIRPQGDVLAEYLEILPSLRAGVIVHIHDIFSPRDYLREWLAERMLLWNEQYLLEAFLTENRSWRILSALNYLRHGHFGELQRACPYLSPDREPGSFYIQRLA
jgi:hypothetical protein